VSGVWRRSRPPSLDNERPEEIRFEGLSCGSSAQRVTFLLEVPRAAAENDWDAALDVHTMSPEGGADESALQGDGNGCAGAGPDIAVDIESQRTQIATTGQGNLSGTSPAADLVMPWRAMLLGPVPPPPPSSSPAPLMTQTLPGEAIRQGLSAAHLPERWCVRVLCVLWACARA
jgi:hypothetical protein